VAEQTVPLVSEGSRLETEPKPVAHLVYVNQKRVETPGVDPEKDLYSFLRERCGLTGTKRGCGEGELGWPAGSERAGVGRLLSRAILSPSHLLHGLFVGGCGACVVLLSAWSEREQRVVHTSVVSCLMPVGAVHLKMVGEPGTIHWFTMQLFFPFSDEPLPSPLLPLWTCHTRLRGPHCAPLAVCGSRSRSLPSRDWEARDGRASIPSRRG
jgi:hypothetical protein